MNYVQKIAWCITILTLYFDYCSGDIIEKEQKHKVTIDNIWFSFKNQ